MKKTYLLLSLLFSGGFAFAQVVLPFSFDGGKNTLPTGMTQSGLGSDYASSPHLKHDNTGDYLVLHYTGQADSLSFAIRYYGGGTDTLNGNFLLQLSDDGITYTTIKLYGDTTGGIVLTNADTRYDTITGIPSTTQYIRWLYNRKINGNVGIGAINLGGSLPMPLKLVAFSGKATTNGNLLSWQIADAKNISGFEVQQAIDGKNFQGIGFVPYQAGRTNFQFTDLKNHHQKDFYRLKIMDVNHQFAFSPVVAVNRSEPSEMFSYAPNPVRSTLYLKSSLGNVSANISLINLAGKALWQHEVFFKNNSAFPVDVENLQTGVYWINIKTAQHTTQFKFIKQ